MRAKVATDTQKAKDKLVKSNNKRLVTAHRNTPKAKKDKITLDWLEMTLKDELCIFTRTEQIKEYAKR